MLHKGFIAKINLACISFKYSDTLYWKKVKKEHLILVKSGIFNKRRMWLFSKGSGWNKCLKWEMKNKPWAKALTLSLKGEQFGLDTDKGLTSPGFQLKGLKKYFFCLVIRIFKPGSQGRRTGRNVSNPYFVLVTTWINALLPIIGDEVRFEDKKTLKVPSSLHMEQFIITL